ncbi:MAG: TIR domain-containing protein [Deltaproteobacteria bacterium]|nr:TIR domain-containing protein [Deltaproteobacteria bacterium]
MTGSTFKYDVFLCHNDKDKPIIERIYDILEKEKHIRPFLDKNHLPPGHPWQDNIADAIIAQVASCAVFVGPHGLGPVQRAEVQLAINRKFKEPTFPVIPVLLPGCEPSNKKHVPPFLSLQTWVDFRSKIGAPDPLKKLIDAIHGKPISEISFSEIETAIQKASRGLLTWPTTLGENQWLPRKELDKILAIISNNSTSTLLLLGEPGSGKSALLAKLGQKMASKGMPVLAIKADLLPIEISNPGEFGNELHLPFNPGECLVKLAEKHRVLLLLDQLDALADLVDLKSERLSVLLDLINSLSGLPNIHIVTSCRKFEYAHDSRLKNLKAEKIKLDLPTWDNVAEILKDKKIEAAGWPVSFRDLLRVPQHLKLFLELCQGPEEPQIFSSYHAMLDRLWEERVVPSGEKGLALLERMAALMAEREEFWLPTVLFQENLSLIDRLIAAGILVKEANGRCVGFCHQTMLDYAKARAWAGGKESLADFVIERQDALFVRPHLWTGLHYLRGADPAIYHREFERLWNFEELRFHLRILMIEFLGQLPDPIDFEAAWLLPYMQDHKLQGKIFLSIKGSPGWFNHIEPYLPFFMKQEDTRAKKVIPVLESAWNFSKEKVLKLLSNNWFSNPHKDRLSLQVFCGLKDWDEEAVSMVCTILRRTNVGRWFVEHLTEAISASVSELAPKIVRAHLDFCLYEVKAKSPPDPPQIPEDVDGREKLYQQALYDPHKYFKELIGSSNDWYRLPKIARANPKAFLDHLWPWFVKIWQSIAKELHLFVTGYRDINATEIRLSHDSPPLTPSNLMVAIEKAVILLAENEPDEYLDFYKRWQDSDLHIVHRLLARGLAKVADKYPDVVLNYLLSDPRRLILGSTEDRHLDSKHLIAAITPYLSSGQLKELVDYIRNWPLYNYEAISDDDPETRFKQKKWEREHSLRLLKAIPEKYLDAETKKFIEREERALPHFNDWDVQFSGVQRVVSPVSKEQMAKASDEHILKLFDKLDDSTGWDHPSRPLDIDCFQ